MSHERLYLTVDETGDPGKRTKGHTHYIIAGCLVNDRNAFENVTRSHYTGTELKFHNHNLLRGRILREAVPFVSGVYYVQFPKKKYGWDGSRGDKTALHTNMLLSLVVGATGNVGCSYVDVTIDHNCLIGDDKVRKVVRDTLAKEGVRSNPVIGDSKSDFGLMTNDFFVGAIGYMLNTPRTGGVDTKKYIRFFEQMIYEVPYRTIFSVRSSRREADIR